MSMCNFSFLYLFLTICRLLQTPDFSSGPVDAPVVALPPLTLLYDALPDESLINSIVSMKVMPWVQINQDAASYKSGVLDIEAITREVNTKTGGHPPTWMMLDIEEPFFELLMKGPNSPEYKKSIDTMVATIRAMKSLWPNSKWTFYGIPNLPYWIEGKGWANATDEQKKKMLESVAAISEPLIAESDWVSVSIYDYYDPSMVIPGSPNSVRGTPESVRMDGCAWRMAQVGLAKLLARGKPVIPNVCQFWAPGGVAPYCRLIPARAFIENQILPAIKAGATGFALWTGMNYRIEIVTDNKENTNVKREKNFGVQEWRAAFAFDYFKGIQPPNWSEPQIRQKLKLDTSRSIIQSLSNIRLWEKLKVLPPLVPPN